VGICFRQGTAISGVPIIFLIFVRKFLLSLWWALRRVDKNEFNWGFELDHGNQLVFLKKRSQRRRGTSDRIEEEIGKDRSE